jgi:hypothetical protein
LEKISWAPKIRQAKIWQLYQNDALGTVDEALVEDVGYGLLQRCRSIWLVTCHEVECPRCGMTFPTGEEATWKAFVGVIPCPTGGCGWETTAHDWHMSWRHRDLLAVAVKAAVQTYLHDYPLTRKAEERMVCIDQLIHAFHISLLSGQSGRSFANNLIEGSHEQVVDLLDRLAATPGGVDKEKWRAQVDEMWRRRRG